MSFLLQDGSDPSSIVDALNPLVELAKSLGPVYQLVTGAAYVIGISLAFKGIYALKVYGEMRTMMASNTGMKEPLMYLFVGAMFIYFPTGFAIVMNTSFGYSSVLQYSEWPGGISSEYAQTYYALFSLIQVIGVIAFVRGWLMLAKGAGQGAPPNSFGKGMTHIVAGVLAMNIIGTAQVVYNTLGLN